MSEDKNHFIYRKQFPQTESILFRKGKSPKEIFKDAIFVLDANTLLAPFNIGKENTEEIKKIYEKLISKNRLFIPEHAFREFAKNRSKRISNLFSHIDNQLSQLPTIKTFEYPILGELESYKKLKESRSEILSKVKEYKESLTELQNEITEWNWSDPVTTMYQSIFSEEIILHLSLSEEELIKEYEERISNEIPPGNKDKSKEINAIGDFVIWKCILELGKKEKKDIIFVSNDEKNDWLLKGNQKSISTKFELVDEFYRFTEGNNFISLNFKTFLDYEGLNIDFIENFYKYENILKRYKRKENNTLKNLEVVKNLISQFLSSTENFITGEDLNEYINGFIGSYKQDYFETEKWSHLYDYFFLFDEWLKEIKYLNDEIIHQENRMKRDTRTDLIKLSALCEEFISKYFEFESLI